MVESTQMQSKTPLTQAILFCDNGWIGPIGIASLLLPFTEVDPMKSTFLVLLLAVPLCAGLNGLSAPSVAPAPVVLPCVALSGVDSQVGEKSYLRISNLKDWVKLWHKHKGEKPEGEYDFHYDPLNLPIVDFERYMVIALFEAPAEYLDGFQADSISETAEKIIFRFHIKGHQTGFARPFPNNPEDSGNEGEDEDPEPVRKAYGFFFVPKSNKMIVMERRFLLEDKLEEAFRFPALK